jgi:uncharacterized membrane protein
MTLLAEGSPRTASVATTWVRIAALLSTGVLAGSFAYGRFLVFPTFYDVPTDIQLRFRIPLMARNAPVMPPLMAAVLLSCAALALIGVGRERLFSGLAAASALICLLITVIGNVPINKQIKTWNVDALPAESTNVLHRWDIYNDLRSAAAIAAFLLVLAVLIPTRRQT